jgi:hypothetical protein
MDTRIFHGEIKARDLAQAIATRFSHGNLTSHFSQSGKQFIVQIASRRDSRSGGKTAIGITIQQNKDGVTVKIGEQEWLGIAASFGATLLSVGRNPLNLLGRLDDIAQDLENLNLDDKIWEVIEEIAFTMGASHQLSEKLRRTGCEYCNTANPFGEPRCIACGAPLGGSQPRLCHYCGFVASSDDVTCQNCGSEL